MSADKSYSSSYYAGTSMDFSLLLCVYIGHLSLMQLGNSLMATVGPVYAEKFPFLKIINRKIMP